MNAMVTIETNTPIYKNFDLADLPGEIWLPIKEYEGHYEISNMGRIKSLERMVYRKKGNWKKKMPTAIRKSSPNSDGYLTNVLTLNAIDKTYSVHVLVGRHFVPNPLNLPELNHINGEKLDCRGINLEYTDRKTNMQHAVKSGLRTYRKGIKCTRFKLKASEVIEIFNSKDRSTILALKYNVTRSTIQRIRNGRNYKDLINKPDGSNQ